ncbi:MAG: response regulator [Verrucomicrobiota bacterium]
MKKILLVDDDAVVRLLYQRKLEQGGFEVALAEDGLQAIQLLGAHTPDLVLLDLMMPKLSGDNVLRFIRTHPKLAKLPVVVLTNAFMSDQARTVSALGVARAIVKADLYAGQDAGNRRPASQPELPIAGNTAGAGGSPRSHRRARSSPRTISCELGKRGR